jgi:hypothetical protein
MALHDFGDFIGMLKGVRKSDGITRQNLVRRVRFLQKYVLTGIQRSRTVSSEEFRISIGEHPSLGWASEGGEIQLLSWRRSYTRGCATIRGDVDWRVRDETTLPAALSHAGCWDVL